MSSSTEDTLGCLVLAAALAYGSYWLYDKYEVKERDDPKIALASDSSPASARDYLPDRIHVTSTDAGTLYYLEPDTVKGPKTARVGWVVQDQSRDKGQLARTSRQLVWTNCETNEVKTLSFIQYDKSGKVLDSRDYPVDEAAVAYFPPGTIGAAAPTEMCHEMFDKPSAN